MAVRLSKTYDCNQSNDILMNIQMILLGSVLMATVQYEEYNPQPILVQQGQSDIWSEVGIPERGERLFNVLEKGFSYHVFSKVAKATGLDQKVLAQYVSIPPATLARRAKSGVFKLEESDRLYRYIQVLSKAIDLFEGDTASAQQWVKQPVKGLGEKSPFEMLTTTAGTEAVLDLIGRLEHGVLS